MKTYQFFFVQFMFIVFSFCPSISYGVKVLSYYGVYDAVKKQPGRVSESLTGPITEEWQSPEPLQTPYKIGVLVPHLKDKYWLGINYGIIEQAKKLGVSVKLYSAGSYSKGGVQRRQLTNELIKEEVDGIILSTIFYDKLDRYLAQVNQLGIPVVALVNDIRAPSIKAKVMVSFYDIGYSLGEFIIRDSQGRDIRIGAFPGPKNSGWAKDTFLGLTQAIRDNPGALPLGKVTIVAEQYGVMNKKMQSRLVDFVLDAKDNLDYLVGNAVAAAEAVEIARKYQKRHPYLRIISSYLTPDLYPLLKDQLIYASASDMMVEQARIAVDVVVRILNGEKPGDQNTKLPFRTGPDILMVAKANLKSVPYESLFGVDGFKPLFQYVVGS